MRASLRHSPCDAPGVSGLLALPFALACASAPAPETRADSAAARTAARDSMAPADAIPPGKGTLRQDDIAIRLQTPGVQVRLIPLDEDILRVLAPDSYRALRDLLESRRTELSSLAARRGMRGESVWYVSFHGLEPEARFVPTDVMITSLGRDYRPVEILPLSAGFGAQRLRQRETLSALYLFEDGLEVEQPLTIAVGDARSAGWETTLRRIRQERAVIRGRS